MADDSFHEVPPEFAEILVSLRLTATPALRVEQWLEEVERRCKSSIAQVEARWPSIDKKVAAAKVILDQAEKTAETTKTKRSKRNADGASQKYYKALSALRPDIWWLSHEAMRNAELVRENLAAGKADEAVEAALRTMNATWKLHAAHIAGPLRAAARGHKSWSRGGQKRARLVKEDLKGRNLTIARARNLCVASGETSFPRIVGGLADRFKLSKRTIKRILKEMDTT